MKAVYHSRNYNNAHKLDRIRLADLLKLVMNICERRAKVQIYDKATPLTSQPFPKPGMQITAHTYRGIRIEITGRIYE